MRDITHIREVIDGQRAELFLGTMYSGYVAVPLNVRAGVVQLCWWQLGYGTSRPLGGAQNDICR